MIKRLYRAGAGYLRKERESQFRALGCKSANDAVAPVPKVLPVCGLPRLAKAGQIVSTSLVRKKMPSINVQSSPSRTHAGAERSFLPWVDLEDLQIEERLIETSFAVDSYRELHRLIRVR